MSESTEELRAENARLRAALEQQQAGSEPYELAFDKRPEAACLLDAQGRALHVNDAFLALARRSREQAIGRAPAELLDLPALAREALSALSAAIDRGVPFDGRVTCGLDELRIDLEISLTPLAPAARDTGPGRARFLAVYRDVTERLRSEQELRESRQLYREIFQNNRAIKLLLDPETGAIVDANSAASQFYGYPVEQLLRMNIADINTLAGSVVTEQMLRASTGPDAHFWFPHRLASGELRLVEVFTGPIGFRGRKLLLSIIQDVTARERAEEAFFRSEAKFRSLIEQLAVGVAVHRDGLFVYVNPALVSYLGHEQPAELLGTPLLDIVHPDDRPGVIRRVAAIVERGERAPLTEERLLRRDGSVLLGQILAIPLVFDGAPAVLAIVHDITERHRLEQQVRQSHRMEAVGRLAGGVAHDFNNLLFVILNSAHFLMRRAGPGDLVHRDAEQIYTAARRAADLTRQLLHFSRGAETKSEVLDVGPVVQDIRRLLEGTIGEQIELSVSLAPEPCHVKMGRANLEQILVNLAVNARDAMPRGGMLRIETSLVHVDEPGARRNVGLRPGRHVRLAVSDTGTGMSPEVAAHAFEPFFTTKERTTGTGLGLAITYGIVQKAGGHITLESTPGEGTRVVLCLPLTEPLPAASGSPPPPPPSPTPRGRGETILVVEDEPAVRAVVARVLEGGGYHVLLAPGPGEALLLVEQRKGPPIELLLSDVVMLHISGPELATRLSRMIPGLRVLYMSGYEGDAIARHGVGKGRVDLLQKPFTEEELLGRVQELLSRPR